MSFVIVMSYRAGLFLFLFLCETHSEFWSQTKTCMFCFASRESFCFGKKRDVVWCLTEES